MAAGKVPYKGFWVRGEVASLQRHTAFSGVVVFNAGVEEQRTGKNPNKPPETRKSEKEPDLSTPLH